eukprot:726698-Pleurochrysis_carterae.AAC.2
MADTGSAQADHDLRIFRDRFKLTLQEKPKQFLGMNIDMRDDGGASKLPPLLTSRRKQKLT